MWSSGFERGPCCRNSRRKPRTRGALQFLAPNEGPFCALCRLDGNFELIFGQLILVWYQSLLSEIHFTLIKAICCTFELAVTYIIHCWWCTRINIAPMNAWLSKCVRNVCAETHTLPVWAENPFSCDGLSGGNTSPGRYQSRWGDHSAVMVRAEEPHHLGAASLGGESIQLWWPEWRKHITWVLPIWVERAFSGDCQSGGTTSPGWCQSGWRDHSAVMVRAEEPHHLGAASLGGEAIQLWWSERRNHITWVLPVWVETPFSGDYPSGGTTSPGCCQSGWRGHSAVTVRAEEPPHLGDASLGGETIQLWWSERRNHITWVLPVWVERPFSCDGQSGGTTSPECCQSGWKRHSVVIVWAEEPHHLGAANLGGDAIQLWRSGRRNHITWVMPVWMETPFSCDGQGGGTTSPGRCQSRWGDHSAVMVRAEEPHLLGAASLGGDAIQLWRSGRRNHITWLLPVWMERPFGGDGQDGETTITWTLSVILENWGNGTNHMLKFEELELVILEYMEKRGDGTSHLWHGKSDSLFFDRGCWPHVLRVLDLKAVTGTWTHLLELLLWAVWGIDGFLWNPPYPGILVTQGK